MPERAQNQTYEDLVNEFMRDSIDSTSFNEAECRMILEMEVGWKPWPTHFLNGSRIRTPLITYKGEFESIFFDEEALILLWPQLFISHDRESSHNLDPVNLQLPNGVCTEWELKYLEESEERFSASGWGGKISPTLQKWLKQRKAMSGDTLIIEAVDVEARQYNLVHEHQAIRPKADIRNRTEAIENAAFDFIWRNDGWAPNIWGLAGHLLIAGYYKYPTPPEPFKRIWNRVRPPEGEEKVSNQGRKVRREKARAAHQLKILLLECEPPIWRRVLMTDNSTLHDLHQVIQQSMGWTDCHLHQFRIEGTYYSDPVFRLSDYAEPVYDEYQATLGEIADWNPESFFYEYNFGERWVYEIAIEETRELMQNESYPQCIGGEREAPPEGCHGVSEYIRMLNDIEDPNDYFHEGYLMWIGGYCDPEHFNPTLINKKFNHPPQSLRVKRRRKGKNRSSQNTPCCALDIDMMDTSG